MALFALAAMPVIFESSQASNSAQSRSVYIYGNIASVNEEWLVNGSEICVELPPGAIIQTLTASADNGMVTEIRVPGEEAMDLLIEDDRIVVKTKTETYIGSFIRLNVNLLVEVEGRLVIIPTHEIVAIELVGPVPSLKESEDSIKVKISVVGEGKKKLTLSYLVRDLSWSQIYDLDIVNEKIKTWGIINSDWDFGTVDLNLIVGEPRLVFTPLGSEGFKGLGLTAMDNSRSYQSAPLGEYHEYHIGQVMLRSSEILKLLMFSGEVDLEQFYYWNGGDVEEKFNLTNIFTEPLGPGRIEFYRNGRWVGEDLLDYTSINGSSIVTVGSVQDVKIEEKTILWETGKESDLIEKRIEITSYKDSAVTITVERSLPPNGNYLGGSVKPTIEGKLMIWHIEVEAGGVVQITYQYEVIHRL